MENKRLIIGLDIGIASVGWAVLQLAQDETEHSKIIDLGVRCFDKAEQAKTGEPLNLARRLQRNSRTRLAHRAKRLKALCHYLALQGLIESSAANALATPANSLDPWQLRVKALDELLTGAELARAIYHLVKHRGYYVARKAEQEQADSKSEQGRMSQAVKETEQRFANNNYRTVAELVLNDPDFKEAKRNKAGHYTHTFYRKLLRDELREILESQQRLGNRAITEDFIAKIDHTFWFQRPALSGEDMLKMLGHCSHEKDQYRAARRSYSAERFVWLSSLNNLRIREQSEIRALTEQERQSLINLPYQQEKITYKTLRTTLKKHHDFPSDSYFTGLAGSNEEQLSKAEAKTFFHSKGYHELRKAFTEAKWQSISQDPALLDQLATTLTLYKSDEEITEQLTLLAFTQEEIAKLLTISFSEFINLSLKAVTKLLPFLEAGKNYYEACELAGYTTKKNLPKSPYLPPLYQYEFDKLRKHHKRIPDIKNPVVMRALNQARKVINEIIRRYGAPSEVHIELARDLSKPFAERQKISRQQDTNRQLKEAIREEITQERGQAPNAKELLKRRLYQEQDGKCAYSLKAIEISRLYEEGYVEIDHILPYSRSFDDSLNNKVLVLNAENQNKANRTPYEYLNGANDSEQWQRFVAWSQTNHKYTKGKKERLFRKNFGEQAAQEFAERNLNDTRYISRFFFQFIKDHLQFADNAPKVPVLTPSGGLTSLLRARWGLIKNREQSDLHHALDACVVAATTTALIKRVAEFSKQLETHHIIQAGQVVDTRTGEIKKDKAYFPRPWPTFREEVIARLSANPAQQIADKQLANYSPEQLASLKPIFVSRMPKRRNGGALHQETIRSAKFLANQQSAIRKPLTSLKLADLDKLVGRYLADGQTPDPRNEPLINALRERLEAYNGDAKKAFAEPFYKPNKTGESSGQLVRTVKVLETQKGGVPVRGGIADQDSMWRVDVFEKGGKYFLVPLYQIDRQPNKPLPNKAATAGKPREEWPEMDDSYQFKFSLSLNDGLYIKTKKQTYQGYFAGLDISTAAINIRSHDNNNQVGKKGAEGIWRSIGLKTGVEQFIKLHVDMLGNYYPAKEESRRGMA